MGDFQLQAQPQHEGEANEMLAQLIQMLDQPHSVELVQRLAVEVYNRLYDTNIPHTLIEEDENEAELLDSDFDEKLGLYSQLFYNLHLHAEVTGEERTTTRIEFQPTNSKISSPALSEIFDTVEDMWNEITRLVNQYNRQILIYVHGFDNSEASAKQSARKLQKMCWMKAIERPDMQKITVLAFSWDCACRTTTASISPSVRYLLDKTLAHNYCGKELYNNVLKVIFANDLHTKTSILAHSMGNYVLQRAMHEYYADTSAGRLQLKALKALFSFAADVSTEEYFDAIGKSQLVLTENVHVFFCPWDCALIFSKYGLKNGERLGLTKKKLQGFYDCSKAKDSTHGNHTYYLMRTIEDEHFGFKQAIGHAFEVVLSNLI